MSDELSCFSLAALVVTLGVALRAWFKSQALAQQVERLQQAVDALRAGAVGLDEGKGREGQAGGEAVGRDAAAAGQGAEPRTSDLVPLEPLSPPPPAAAAESWETLAAKRRAQVRADYMARRQAADQSRQTSSPSAEPAPATASAPAPGPAEVGPARPPLGSEQLLVRVLVLVGGVVLALAGVYFAKYAYERGLLGPQLRLAIGAAFGLLLVGAGEWLRQRSGRVAQATVAAGVAVLFAVILAGRHVEDLLAPLPAFVLMAVVTVAAVVLSLRHGPFVAVLGLIGGFATPALVGSNEHSTGSLFGYLLILQIGLLVVIRRRGWWWLSLLMLVGGLGWAALWMLFNYWQGDSVWLGLYLLLLGGMTIATTGDSLGDKPGLSARDLAGWIGGIVSIVLAALLVPVGDYGWLEWGYFGLLGAGAIVVGRWRESRAAMPVVAAVISLILLAVWIAQGPRPDQHPLLITVLLVGFVLHGLTTYACAWGSGVKPLWAWLSASSSVLLGLLTYAHFHEHWPAGTWLGIHGALALGYAAMTVPWQRRRDSDSAAALVVAATVTACCFFLAMIVPMELERHWIGAGWALLAMAIALADLRLRIDMLRLLAALAATLSVVLLIPALPEIDPPVGQRLIVNWFLFGHGVSAAALAVAAWCYRAPPTRSLREFFVVLSGVLLLALVTLEIRHGFRRENWLHGLRADNTLWEWGCYPIFWLLLGVGMTRVARAIQSVALPWLAAGLTGVTVLYCGAVLLLLQNPWWRSVEVGSTPVLNVLLFTYGGPSALLLAIGYSFRRRGLRLPGGLLTAAGLVLLFALVNLQVRQGFHGSPLTAAGAMSHAERYAYSLAWVLLAAVLLVAGIVTRSLLVRWAALIILLLTIGKTFLDTRDLKDLYRVASFLGLGLALMAVGYLYHRFVFRQDAKVDET